MQIWKHFLILCLSAVWVGNVAHSKSFSVWINWFMSMSSDLICISWSFWLNLSWEICDKFFVTGTKVAWKLSCIIHVIWFKILSLLHILFMSDFLVRKFCWMNSICFQIKNTIDCLFTIGRLESVWHSVVFEVHALYTITYFQLCIVLYLMNSNGLVRYHMISNSVGYYNTWTGNIHFFFHFYQLNHTAYPDWACKSTGCYSHSMLSWLVKTSPTFQLK